MANNGTMTTRGFIPHLHSMGAHIPVALKTRILLDGTASVYIKQGIPVPEMRGTEFLYVLPGGGRATAQQILGGELERTALRGLPELGGGRSMQATNA